MNKFEKLIEYIINDEDQKARELFHTIVVEKSRDIYESIMDEESMEEAVHGQPVEDMVDEIGNEESHAMETDEEGEEQELDAGEPEMGSDDLATDEFGGEEAGEEEIEDKVMNIDAKLDELLAKFDEIMGDDSHGEEPQADEFGGEEPADDMGAEMGAEEPAMMEAGNPFAKSGKSGSAASGKSGSAASGKSGSAKSGNPFAKSGKSGSGKTEGKKSTTELMREYVDRIGDIYGGAGDAAEGDAVGAGGKKTAINTKYTGKQEGPDFGGTAVKASSKSENQDGTSPTKASNEYNKGQSEIKSGNLNVPGGNAGKAGFKTKEGEYSTENGKEGQTTDGSVPVAKKSVQVQNTGKK